MDDQCQPVNRVYAFEIIGKPRSQKNSKQILQVRGRTMLVSDSKVQRWAKEAVRQLEAQWMDQKPLDGDLSVLLMVYLGKGQRGDTDNLAAGPLDALQKARGIRNDSIFSRVAVVRNRDPDNPRVKIFICPRDWLDAGICVPGSAS